MNSPMCVRGFVSLLLAVLLLNVVSGDTTALSINIQSPAQVVNTNEIEFKTDTSINASCNLVTNGMTDIMPYEPGTEKIHVLSKTMSDGNHQFNISCVDNQNSSITSTKSSSVNVDTSAPTVLSHSPIETNKESIEFTITTDEESTCRYSEETNVDFFDMGAIFSVTGHSNHKTRMDFDTDGVYDFYIKCRDVAGNINTNDYRATIPVDVPPTARVVMTETSPVSSGTVLVRVITSEPLISTPELRYSLQDSQGKVESFNIPLSGDGQNWEGYMIISDSGGRRIGSFQFSGLDYGGNQGTKITSGSTFIVDSTIPARIEDFKVTPLNNGRMRLEWEYDKDQDIEKYNIYRSTSPGVTRLDYYDYSTEKGYIDSGLNDNTIYYYRILAVDNAGNIGTLSRELDARAKNDIVQTNTEQTSQEQSASGLSSNLLPVLEEAISKHQGLKKLVDDLVLYYRGQSNIEENILSDLNIMNRVSGAKGKVYSFMNEFENLKNQDLTENELKNEIRSIEIKLETVKSEIPISIVIKEKIETSSSANMQKVMNSVDGLLNLFRIINLEQELREKYIQESLGVNERFSITEDYYVIDISYNSGDSETILLVNKKISQIGETLIDEANLLVIEEISEDITTNTRDINFISPKPELLKNTMFKWDLTKLDGEIKYYVQGNLEEFTEDLITSVILDDYRLHFDELGREVKEEKSNFLTGLSIFSLPESGNLKNILGIVIGIIIVAGLGIYYFTMDSEESIIDKFKKKKKEFELKKKNTVDDSNQKLHQVYTEMSSSLNLPPIDVHIKPPGEQGYISKIQRAQTLINNLNFKEASEIYIKTLEELKLEQNNNTKNKAIEELHKLYDKLNLYQNIVYFQESMKNKDLNNLQQHIRNITENYNKLRSMNETESQLMNLAKENHQNYVNFLNNEGYMPKY